MLCVNRRPSEDHSFQSFHMKQVAEFVEDDQVMLEEIFSNANSYFFQPKVYWILPPMYDEYIENGVLIVYKNQKFMSTIL